MTLFIMVLSLAVANAGVLKDNEKECEGVIINDIYHEKDVLTENLDRPYMLTTDYSTNTLYFSYSVNQQDDDFKTAKVDINTKEFSDIEGINNGFTQAVDPKTHDVYIGGSDGIYKYNPNTKKVDLVSAKGVDIWYVYYKNTLYYSAFPEQFLYTINDGEIIRYKDLEDTKVDYFLIDKDDDVFFTNHTGLYSQKRGSKDSVLYQEFENGSVRALTTDVNGDVYLCFKDGIYKVTKNTTSVELIVSIDDGFGVSFDKNNNIIYSDANKLVRLKPNKEKTC